MADSKARRKNPGRQKNAERDAAAPAERIAPAGPEMIEGDRIDGIPLIYLKEMNVFPGISVSFDIPGGSDAAALRAAKRGAGLLLVMDAGGPAAAEIDVAADGAPQEDHGTGCVVRIRQSVELPSAAGYKVVAEGIARGTVVRYYQKTPFITVEANLPEKKARQYEEAFLEAHRRMLLKAAEAFGAAGGGITPEIAAALREIRPLTLLTDMIASAIRIRQPERRKILETVDAAERSDHLRNLLERETEIALIERSLMERVRVAIDRGQKEYFLREQIKAIQEELGDKTGTADEAERYEGMLDALPCGEETAVKLRKEIRRLASQPPGSPEGAQIRNYLDTVFDLPWGRTTHDRLSVAQARRILNRDHYGLEKVKERILEFIAVQKLRGGNGALEIKGPILCLVGPPGVGKTSIARSLARALGRKYARMSLGGVRDEAEIRGHRRTYIGSMPGRFIQALKQAGTDNPLILLDEIDKVGSDYRGDPSSALLEVLDSEQNHAFRDHYLEIPYDLSKVLFITTANTVETIPPALADRMEMVFLSGYTEEEKTEIAMRHIVGKTVRDNALRKDGIIFTRAGMLDIIRYYTRESGVRELERQIARICRKAAIRVAEGETGTIRVTPGSLEGFLGKRLYRHGEIDGKDQVGVATGLAWTPAGGDTLAIEVEMTDGTGQIELTGQLGDIMRESAKIAISYVRRHCGEYVEGCALDEKKNIHIHVPAGAIPKDGPSAGIALAAALMSAVTGRPADRRVALTGELTLRGRVLPVGGLKEKLIAAVRAGIRKAVIPAENVRDLEELPASVRSRIGIVAVTGADEALKAALLPGSGG